MDSAAPLEHAPQTTTLSPAPSDQTHLRTLSKQLLLAFPLKRHEEATDRQGLAQTVIHALQRLPDDIRDRAAQRCIDSEDFLSAAAVFRGARRVLEKEFEESTPPIRPETCGMYRSDWGRLTMDEQSKRERAWAFKRAEARDAYVDGRLYAEEVNPLIAQLRQEIAELHRQLDTTRQNQTGLGET
jgi:hypothetical protein